MGTLVGITLYARTPAEAKNAFQKAYARLAQLNKILSDYDPASELNRISTTPTKVSPELYTVLQFARQLSQDSGGAFDPTIGPLTRLWRRRAPLTPEARALVNWHDLILANGTAALARPGMQLDLGAIGKGFAADELRKTLKSLGLGKILIAASGDIVCGDAPPHEPGWKVQAAGRPRILKHAAVSTSGDTTQFFVKDGRRYSHILDPRTGASLTDVIEIAVVAPNGMTADALATTARVLGRAAAQPLARKYNAQILEPAEERL